jgi:vacuolar-type H+-ATPase subunit C/Vma6
VIGGIPRYANLSARARALTSFLIRDQEWHTLLTIEDLPLFVDTLGDLPYARDLSLPDPPSLRTLEILFYQKVAQDYHKFVAMTRGALKSLLHELWRQFELDNLKTILRTLAEERAVSDEGLIIPLEDSELPWAQLSHATDLQTAAAALSDTDYGPALADALPRYESEGSLFPVEVALDLGYWRRVWKAVTRLRGEDQDWARRLVGSRLDRLNVTWAFRYRIYYHLSEEEIINYTLPYGYRSDDRILRAIAAGAGIEEIVAGVWGEGVPEFVDLARDSVRETLQAFEAALMRMECRHAHRPFSGHPFHLGLLLGYLIRKECEAHDLTTLAESKAEALSAREVEPYLVSFRP